MSPIRALGGTAVVLLVMATAACDGGGSGAPSDASVDDFCAAYASLFSGGMSEIDPSASEREQSVAMVAALRTWAAELADVGTPDDMSDEARTGFDLVLSAAADLPSGEAQDLADLDDHFTEEEMAATEALEQYATQTCESQFDTAPTHTASTD
jgi:hypothetical protein